MVIAKAECAYLENSLEDDALKCKQIKTQKKLFTKENLAPTISPSLDEETQNKLLDLINKYRHCFAENLSEIGKSKIGEFSIELEDNTPVFYKPYRLSTTEQEFVKEQIKEMKDFGIIQESNSPYASPIL